MSEAEEFYRMMKANERNLQPGDVRVIVPVEGEEKEYPCLYCLPDSGKRADVSVNYIFPNGNGCGFYVCANHAEEIDGERRGWRETKKEGEE